MNGLFALIVSSMGENNRQFSNYVRPLSAGAVVSRGDAKHAIFTANHCWLKVFIY